MGRTLPFYKHKLFPYSSVASSPKYRIVALEKTFQDSQNCVSTSLFFFQLANILA